MFVYLFIANFIDVNSNIYWSA